MAHEITQHDDIRLNNTAAWHGMGTVVKEDETPLEALRRTSCDHDVALCPLLVRMPNGELVEWTAKRATVRVDIQEEAGILGWVSKDYVPVQNEQLCQFAESLADVSDKKVICETLGSIRGGKRFWALCRSEAYTIGVADENYSYVLLSNGHDGQAQFRITPTSVRVVCSNTLHSVIPRTETGELHSAAFVIRHTKNAMDRVDEAREALKRFTSQRDIDISLAQQLAAKQVRQQDLQEFFTACYEEFFTEIPTNPQDVKEERRKSKAIDAFGSFTRRFDDEKELIGTASVWGMLNAMTGLIQHDMKTRGTDDADRVTKRISSNLFGLNEQRSQVALKKAYELIG